MFLVGITQLFEYRTIVELIEPDIINYQQYGKKQGNGKEGDPNSIIYRPLLYKAIYIYSFCILIYYQRSTQNIQNRYQKYFIKY